MASNKKPLTTKSEESVDAFLKEVASTPLVHAGGARGRLIFALDATASRQPTWDHATRLQREMFQAAASVGDLDVQLIYYRGMGECRASKWLSDADKLSTLMQTVSCLAGQTQIERILRHGIGEARIKPVHAMVFVGDCLEENIDRLGSLAGQLKLLGLPLFIFQEGNDLVASRGFPQLAQLSGGAHCRFDESSATQLGQLLRAVAVYAAGGRKALVELSGRSDSAAALLEQLG